MIITQVLLWYNHSLNSHWCAAKTLLYLLFSTNSEVCIDALQWLSTQQPSWREMTAKDLQSLNYDPLSDYFISNWLLWKRCSGLRSRLSELCHVCCDAAAAGKGNSNEASCHPGMRFWLPSSLFLITQKAPASICVQVAICSTCPELFIRVKQCNNQKRKDNPSACLNYCAFSSFHLSGGNALRTCSRHKNETIGLICQARGVRRNLDTAELPCVSDISFKWQ